MVHPCDLSNDSRSSCRTRSAYATPLIRGLSKAVLSAYCEKVSYNKEEEEEEFSTEAQKQLKIPWPHNLQGEKRQISV
jgi:hypothetical protein